jgi:hypothetical protein
MSQAEKESILSKIMNLIPGVKGYRAKEARRDTDRRLRGFIADQLDDLRGKLEELKAHLIDNAQLNLLAQLDRVTKKLLKTADSLRFASYGYKGFFDTHAIREEELNKIYQYDYQLLQQVENIKKSIIISPSNSPEKTQLDSLEEHLRKLDEYITQRKHLLESEFIKE